MQCNYIKLTRIDKSQPKIYIPLKNQEYDNYVQVAKDLMESANEIFDTAKHFPYTELGPDMSQEQVRELLSVELTQDKYRKIYNSPYEGQIPFQNFSASSTSNSRLKFIYSEKATKFYKIFTLLLTVTTQDKNKVKILQNFVAFSEYMNFTSSKLSCQ